MFFKTVQYVSKLRFEITIDFLSKNYGSNLCRKIKENREICYVFKPTERLEYNFRSFYTKEKEVSN